MMGHREIPGHWAMFILAGNDVTRQAMIFNKDYFATIVWELYPSCLLDSGQFSQSYHLANFRSICISLLGLP